MGTPSLPGRKSVLVLACAIPLALLVGCSTGERLLSRIHIAPQARRSAPADEDATRGVVAHGPRPVRSQGARVLQRPLNLMPSWPPDAPADPRTGAQKATSSAPEGAVTSPDKAWIAFESDKEGMHGVWVARPDGEQARRVSGRRLASLPKWSPDGKSLVFLAHTAKHRDDWAVWVVEVPDGTPRKLTSTASAAIAGFAWFPDGRHICYGNNEWLIIVDTSDATTRAFRPEDESARIVGVPAVSPDGRSIVFAVAGDGAWMASMRDGSLTQVVTEEDVDAFAWAPGGSQIAFRTAHDGQWKVQVVRIEK